MTVPVVTGARADACCGDGGGGGCAPGTECLPSNYIDPDECEGVSCDYLPYCLNDNGDDPLTTILALTPFAYYPLDDASGNPQDASGNGNHASATAGTLTYQDAALSTKTVASLGLSNGGRIVLPQPNNLLFEPWAMVTLIEFTAADSGVGGNADNSAMFFSQGTNASAWTFGRFANGALHLVSSGQQKIVYPFPGIPLNTPVVLALSSEVYNEGGGDPDPDQVSGVWVNGVYFGPIPTFHNSGGDDASVCIGRHDSSFWRTPNTRWSNLVMFDRALSVAEIKTVTEVLLDANIAADGWLPS